MMVLSKRYSDDGKPSIKLTKKQNETKNRVKEKEKTGYYSFHKISCECGNKTDFDIIAQKDRYGLSIQTCICKNCGLILSNPAYDQDSLNKFYDEDYRDLYVPSDGPNEQFFMDQYRHGIEIGKFINTYIQLDQNKAVLEIGTGAGGILKAISDMYNAKVVGIDLGGEYIEYGKQHGLNLYKHNSATYSQTGQKFDVIILSHVIEHFLDLNSELEHIKKLLKPNGIIYIEVPGIKYTYITYGTLIRSIQNAHIRYFSLDTLKQILGWYGYKCIKGDESIKALFLISDNANKNIIHNYYTELLNFLLKHERIYLWHVGVRRLLLIERGAKQKIHNYFIGEIKNDKSV